MLIQSVCGCRIAYNYHKLIQSLYVQRHVSVFIARHVRSAMYRPQPDDKQTTLLLKFLISANNLLGREQFFL